MYIMFNIRLPGSLWSILMFGLTQMNLNERSLQLNESELMLANHVFREMPRN